MPAGASLPHPHLIALRSAVTVLLSAVVAQAGWASAFLGGRARYHELHEIGAWVTIVIAMATAALYLVLRRSAGAVNVTLAIVVAVAVLAQAGLGFSGVADVHIFLGVLIAMVTTALTSWTYRHSLPEPSSGVEPGKVSAKPRSQ